MRFPREAITREESVTRNYRMIDCLKMGRTTQQAASFTNGTFVPVWASQQTKNNDDRKRRRKNDGPLRTQPNLIELARLSVRRGRVIG
jgi:hypothetical protein